LFPPGTTNVYTEILLLGSPCLCASISAQICPSESSCCIGKHLQEEPTYCSGQYSEGGFPSCNRKCMPASVSLFALHTTLCHILDFFVSCITYGKENMLHTWMLIEKKTVDSCFVNLSSQLSCIIIKCCSRLMSRLPIQTLIHLAV
jgi:hypothetical protein